MMVSWTNRAPQNAFIDHHISACALSKKYFGGYITFRVDLGQKGLSEPDTCSETCPTPASWCSESMIQGQNLTRMDLFSESDTPNFINMFCVFGYPQYPPMKHTAELEFPVVKPRRISTPSPLQALAPNAAYALRSGPAGMWLSVPGITQATMGNGDCTLW